MQPKPIFDVKPTTYEQLRAPLAPEQPTPSELIRRAIAALHEMASKS